MTSLWRTGQRLLRITSRLIAPKLLTRKIVTRPAVKALVVKAASVKPVKALTVQPAAKPANPGQLDQIVHVPPKPRRGAPLVVLLHGCDQEPAALAEASGWRQLADEMGFVLLMPRQRADNNSHRCFNWYNQGDTTRDHGEAASIRAMVADTLARRHCDPKRVFVTGLSAGGAMTACLLAAYPEVFAAGAVVAGLPAGAAHSVVGALTRMAGHGGSLPAAAWAVRARALGTPGFAGAWPRLSVWHGSADPVVAPANGTDLAAQWGALTNVGPPRATTMPQKGLRRTQWQSATGTVQVELWEVEGMGHCYPSSTQFTQESVVPTNPVWAALEIVSFWGINSRTIHGKLTGAMIPAR
jgi:poly(hydroxyalkanoate) depolymerase family esterase